MLLVGHLNLKCASIWLGNENVKLTVFPVKLLHNWLAQLLVVHQLTCDYRPCFPGICDATNALLIYAVIWTFISNSACQGPEGSRGSISHQGPEGLRGSIPSQGPDG